ncbi:lipopolysaccharide biosynthesis protein [Homoserinimonas aerilata]|uniref:lipopolysaccharide biosynthesis protein n=1 Tax=Homoserinimonas aerilata TaxID=1162970 RepID=UPI00114F31F6|nr:hypothetical protein [Homoserinimonas aerilata]
MIGRVGVRGVAVAMQAVCMVLIARQQGPAVFGLYAIGIAAGAISGTILGLGSSSRALRILREREPVVMASSLALVRLVGSAFSWLVVACILLGLGAPWPIALAVGLIAATDQVCEVEQATRAGFLEQASSTYVILIQRLLPFIAVCIGWYFQGNVIVWYAAAALLVMILVLVKPIRRFDGRLDLPDALRGSLGYWIASLSQALQQFDVPVVRLVVGEVGVGLYSAANRLVGPLGILVNSVVVVVAPKLGTIQDARHRLKAFLRLTMWVAAFGVVIAIASPLVAEIAIWLLGPEYSAARPLLIGITIAAAVSVPSQVLQSYLYFEKRPGSVARVGYFSVGSGLIALAVSGTLLGTSWLWLGPFTMYILMTTLLIYVVMRGRERHRPTL